MVGEVDSNEPQTVVDGGGGEVVPVNVRCSNGSKFIVRTSLESTVESFKALVAQNCDVPANQQRLIYKGRILKDDHTLLSYGKILKDLTFCGLQADHALHVVRGSAPPGSQTTAPSVTRGVASNTGGESLFGFNPLSSGNAMPPGLFGAAGLPDLEQAQQQLAQNPNMVQDMMNAPAIQNIMNNPELMRTLIMSNPQMRELVDRNPELGHILNDPSVLRQSLEAARNPELMREMTRSTDRAMSNIEATSEGFNMLRRMYENVQEPLMNATTNNAGSNPFATLLGNQGAASNNPMTTNAETGTGNAVPNTNPLPNPWGSAGQTTTAGRTNSGGDTRAPGLGGVGMLGGDPTIMSLNPQLQSLMDSSPQVREMMQNPEFLRMLSSPETMQQMMSLQQSLLSGNRSTTRGTLGIKNINRYIHNSKALSLSVSHFYVCNNGGMDSLMNIFGSFGAGGGLSGSNQSNVPPEELYATQLQQLEEMGFFDRAENIRALRATNGNVNAAVERLLGSISQ
ncbi:hypothetical protein F2Q68_00028824 [Brassica cretica]|uniref:Ubiquilin n=1 Tax=Brassica cretica TaxID=69181 RepID=A0A8S9GE69_BRACR|nr:hypothetical protein F2Q68_00028824 [Brassica cretica]